MRGNANVGLTVRLIAGLFAAAFGLFIPAVAAEDMSASRGRTAASNPDLALMRFYPAPLAWQSEGMADDAEVWMAKVTGLLRGAPTLLRQSLTSSSTAEEFTSNLVLLEQMQESRAQRMASGAAVSMHGARTTLKQLGASDQLVYTALAPCRIMDTRRAAGASGVAGPLVGNTLYSIPGFVTAGSNWSLYGQIGTLSDCGLNSTVGSNIKAVALVITILNPNYDAYLGVSDVNDLSAVLSRVALNYTRGQGLSTLYIVPQTTANAIRFAMPPALSAHLIFDVVGYYARSEATPLDCQVVEGANVVVPVNTPTLVQATCPAGYTATGGGFYIAEGSLGVPGMWLWTDRPVGTTGWRTDVSNQTNGNRTMRSIAVCCRVPGR